MTQTTKCSNMQNLFHQPGFRIKPVFLLTLLYAFGFSAKPLLGKSIIITFSELIKNSKAIVIAKCIDSKDGLSYVEVEDILFGKPTKKKVTILNHHILKKGEKCVVFLDEYDGCHDKHGISWIGTVDNEETIETGIMTLAGATSHNGHRVEPSNLSLIQLKEYLKFGYYKGKVEGTLYFFSAITKKMEPSSMSYTVNYTLQGDDRVISNVESTGMKLKNFLKKPDVSGISENQLLLNYGNQENDDRSSNRPLEIIGKILKLNKDGRTYSAMFYVNEPEALSEKEFEAYISNSKKRE